jgi:hypothetical protein
MIPLSFPFTVLLGYEPGVDSTPLIPSITVLSPSLSFTLLFFKKPLNQPTAEQILRTVANVPTKIRQRNTPTH